MNPYTLSMQNTSLGKELSMTEKKKSFSSRSFGISLLMVLFIVLCFAVNAILALSSAKSNLDSSRQYADRKASYYEACNESEERICKLAGTNSTGAYEWTIPFSDTQHLSVRVVISNGTYDIEKWQTEARE